MRRREVVLGFAILSWIAVLIVETARLDFALSLNHALRIDHVIVAGVRRNRGQKDNSRRNNGQIVAPRLAQKQCFVH